MSYSIEKYYIQDGEIKESSQFKSEFFAEGKNLYEVIRVIEGKFLFLEHHLERLQKSAKLMHLKLEITENEIKKGLKELIRINEVQNGNVKIIFNYKEEVQYFLYFIKHSYPSAEQYERGVSTIIYDGERNNPNVKMIDSNFRQNVQKEIDKKEVYEAILVDRDGYITEGSRSNIFMVKGDKVITAPLESVLPGVTRGGVIDLCSNLGIEVLEQRISREEMGKIDGMFISGTSPKILPISQVDDIMFQSSKNSIILKIMYAYNEKIETYIQHL